MKIFKVLARLLAIFGLTMALAISGWGAVCPSTPNHTFSSAATTFQSSGTIASNADTDEVLYYFRVSQPGIVTFTKTSDSQILHKYDLTTCPTNITGTTLADSNKIVVGASGAFFIRISSGAANKNYNFTLTFEPTPLVISKTNTPMQVAINTPTNVTYTLSVQNTGSQDITEDITVTDTIPTGLTYVSASGAGWECIYTSNTKEVTCTRSATLADGDAAPDINITATANISSESSIVNTANVNSDYNGIPLTNSASSTLLAVSGTGTVDLEIQKYASGDVIPPDTDFQYLIFVINYDNTEAQLVKVTDTLPLLTNGNITIQSAGGNGWTCAIPATVNTSDVNRTIACNYDQPLPKGITYFMINAHTGSQVWNNVVHNEANVTALNPMVNDPSHHKTDGADINISYGGGGTNLIVSNYPEGGYVEISDRNLLSPTVLNRSNAQLWTKIASSPNQQYKAYYVVNTTTGAPADFNPTNNVPLTVTLKLADDECSVASETHLSYNGASVAAVFSKDNDSNPDTVLTSAFQFRNIAQKKSRLVMRYVDINTLLDMSGESCSQSNLSANIKGLPQCIANSVGGSFDNNKYINVFGIAAYMRCAIGNGQPCKSSNGGIGAAPYDTEYGCYECTVGGGGYCSKDNFAIRPKAFDLNITAGSILKAQANNFAFKGLTNNSIIENTLDYNESQDTSFAVDINISDTSKTCAQKNLTISPTVTFQNGLDLRNFRFSNIGDVNLTIHDINGSEFGKVDENDTNPTTSRFITPFTVNYRIIPHHFGLDGNYTNAANGFTYLSNFEEYNTTASREMSASMDMNITAQADNNTTTTNYTENCYAKDGNLMTGITPFSVSPAGSLSKMIWYDLKHDTNGSIPLPLPGTIAIPILHTAFDNNESNGTASVNYLINFDRNQTKLVNPFSVTIGNVDMNDSDSVTGTKAMNTSAYFVYGRIIPRDIRVFGPNAFDANGWYEVFGTMLIGTTALPVSKNDSRWSTNRLHDDLSDGDSNVTRLMSSGTPNGTVNYGGNDALGVEVFGFPAITPTYNGKAHVDTAPWLWYAPNALPYLDPSVANPANAAGNDAACLTHPCFNVTVMPAIGATGSAKDTNEATKASKTSTSGGGGWRSTTDYAPAIR